MSETPESAAPDDELELDVLDEVAGGTLGPVNVTFNRPAAAPP